MCDPKLWFYVDCRPPRSVQSGQALAYADLWYLCRMTFSWKSMVSVGGCLLAFLVPHIGYTQDLGAQHTKIYTLSQMINAQMSIVERQVTALAEMMPEEKYQFSPQGSGFVGVRTFAAQIRHIASSNCASWGAAATIKCQVPINNSNGPKEIRTKSQLIGLLKESFAVGHSAAEGLTMENMSDSLRDEEGGTAPRLFLLTEGMAHDLDHYGQLVEYLRMNNLVPPGSK